LEPNLQFRRFYISSHVPALGAATAFWRSIRELLPRTTHDSAPDPPRDGERIQTTIAPAAVSGPSGRTYDQAKLAEEVRRLLRSVPSEAALLIITDRPITPPEGWRYIIWDDLSPGLGVISTAPCDPYYWRDTDPNRIATIKNRVRSSALTITGIHLGLERCGNPECFMFEDVDSVTAVDMMTELGPEHGHPALAGQGFEANVADPALVQEPVLKQPGRSRSWQ
jgi:hypothetical protein